MAPRGFNRIEVKDGVAYIDVSTPAHPDAVATLDEADLPLLESVPGGRWFASCTNGRTTYVRRTSQRKAGDPKLHFVLHRLVVKAEGHEVVIDHVDRNGLNNTRANLRVASRTQNAANSRTFASNKSGFRGVSACSKTGRFIAQICVDRRSIPLGTWDDAAMAAAAYDGAARVAFGPFASMNFRSKE